VKRRMFRRLSTSEVVEDVWTLFPYPTYYYDALRGSSTCALPASHRTSGLPRQSAWSRSAAARTADAIAEPHPGQLHFAMDEGEGKPGRWSTFRVMRMLRWYEQAH